MIEPAHDLAMNGLGRNEIDHRECSPRRPDTRCLCES
jgi:hypothetical protein